MFGFENIAAVMKFLQIFFPSASIGTMKLRLRNALVHFEHFQGLPAATNETNCVLLNRVDFVQGLRDRSGKPVRHFDMLSVTAQRRSCDGLKRIARTNVQKESRSLKPHVSKIV
jgi:hypothetical protein